MYDQNIFGPASQTATACSVRYKTVHTLRFERLLNFVFTQPHKEKSSPAIWKDQDTKQ